MRSESSGFGGRVKERWLAVAMVSLWAGLAGGQQTGEIRLEVKDPSGSAMEAAGRLERPDTRSATVFHTDAAGTYVVQGLPFGVYRLEVSRAGFLTEHLTINVESAAPVIRTVTLALSQAQAKVDVVATMPLPGVELSREQAPSPIQTATQEQVEQSGALDLTDFLKRRFNGVQLNEMQGNPFQPDLNYRGYTASPLLGTPQGLSVYLDGVRLNEPFGDVVSWDLIPRNAIASATLMPGSNPLFGLNTLGGALSVQTKDGVENHGTTAQVTYGSSGRKALEFEHGGGKATGLNWYFAGNLFHESGWRFDSPSDVRQGFAKLGWRAGKTDLNLHLSYAYNSLTGNGVQEQRFLARDWSSVYTIPDITKDRSPFANLTVRHSFSDTLTFSGNGYFRYIRADTINGNLNNDSLDQSVYQPSAADQAALKAAGYTGYPASGANASNTPFPKWRCIAQALQHADPEERCNGLTTHALEAQRGFGGSGQVTWLQSHGGVTSQFTAGAGFTGGLVDFSQGTQFGYLNPDRSITSVNAFADGSTSVSGVPYDTRVNLHGRTFTYSVFATDTLSLGKAWNVTLSGRYNRNPIHNVDRLTPAGPGSLTGNDVYGRFNPAVGVTYSPLQSLNLFAGYTEGSRAPTSIELGCADPENPCSLPNALAGDPPLRQVVTGTWEAGLRGKPGHGITWSASWYRAENRNDILFVASQLSGSGYFRNFGRTRRQGAEASVEGKIRRVTGGLSYTFLDATYQSAETLSGSSNSANDMALAGLRGIDGTIQVTPGDRIPLVPQHNFKAFADVQVLPKLSVDAELHGVSSSYARGNENNLHQPDGKYYLGPGVSAGYAVVDLRARYDLSKRWLLAFQADNLLNRHYDTAAQLGATGFDAQGNFVARPLPAYSTGDYAIPRATFYAPGAPRRYWAELRLRF